MTSTPGPQADRGRRSQGLGCESELRVRSYGWFHLISEGDGPRHASCETVPPSNLGRPQIEEFHCTTLPRSGQVAVVFRFAANLRRLTWPIADPDNARNGRRP